MESKDDEKYMKGIKEDKMLLSVRSIVAMEYEILFICQVQQYIWKEHISSWISGYICFFLLINNISKFTLVYFYFYCLHISV